MDMFNKLKSTLSSSVSNTITNTVYNTGTMISGVLPGKLMDSKEKYKTQTDI